MAAPKKYTAYLDGIRGTAAFIVFLNHFSLVFYCAYATLKPAHSHLHGLEMAYAQSWFSFLNNGGFAVAIFFVLSGYVLSRSYFFSGNLDTVISGLHRRFIRLYIPIAFTLILSFILLVAHLYYNVQVSRITTSDWFFRQWRFGQPLYRLFTSITYGTMFRGDASFNTCLWTISTEFFGSLFVYALLAFTHFTPRYRLLFICLAMYFFVATVSPFYLAFVLGITLCYTERWLQRHRSLLTAASAFVLLGTSFTLASLPFSGPFSGTWQYTFKSTVWDYTPWCLVAAAYMLVLGFLMLPALQKVFSLRLFRFLGYISFSLYLLHPLLLGSFSSWLFLKLYHSCGYNTSAAIVFIASIGILIPASWLMARYVDQAGINLARRIYTITTKTQPTQSNEEKDTA